MRAFTCVVCGNLLAFENSVCVVCGTLVGYAVPAARLVPLYSGPGWQPCANASLAACNWLVSPREGGGQGGLCPSCRLTRTRPDDTDTQALGAFARTETAKRRLVYQLLDLRLPVVPLREDPAGLAFDLLSSAGRQVTTGHAGGVVTIDLAEGHDAHREALRVAMGEPYRTLLGHLRHETGHYYWQRLVDGSAAAGRFRELFGDERADYAAALDRHYTVGPPPDWGRWYVSAYATAHPWEDWAETFAHYLHIRDALQTAAAYGVLVRGPSVARGEPGLDAEPLEERPGESGDVHELVRTWLPLTFALNAINRSMGKDDMYPFVLTPPVIAKLGFVHDVVTGGS